MWNQWIPSKRPSFSSVLANSIRSVSHWEMKVYLAERMSELEYHFAQSSAEVKHQESQIWQSVDTLDSKNSGHNTYIIFHVFCRLSATTKVVQRRSVKSFSGCSSTREQCRATTWCLRRRTWRRPTKVDASVDGSRPSCSVTRLDVQQPLYSSSSAPPSQLALSIFSSSLFLFCFFYTNLISDLALSNQQFTFPK